MKNNYIIVGNQKLIINDNILKLDFETCLSIGIINIINDIQNNVNFQHTCTIVTIKCYEEQHRNVLYSILNKLKNIRDLRKGNGNSELNFVIMDSNSAEKLLDTYLSDLHKQFGKDVFNKSVSTLLYGLCSK